MAGRTVVALLIGAITVLILVSVFQNGLEFGRWLRDKNSAEHTGAEADASAPQTENE